MLSCQGSNLDSSDPESDVLPITPQDNLDCKVNEYLKNKNPCTVLFPIISVTNFGINPGKCRRSTSLSSICRKNLIRQTAVALEGAAPRDKPGEKFYFNNICTYIYHFSNIFSILPAGNSG
jgi:hypothetical protein